MRRIALYPLYFLVITPLGRLMALIHDPLHRRWDPKADSYLTVPPRRVRRCGTTSARPRRRLRPGRHTSMPAQVPRGEPLGQGASQVPEHNVQADQAVLGMIEGGGCRADDGEPE